MPIEAEIRKEQECSEIVLGVIQTNGRICVSIWSLIRDAQTPNPPSFLKEWQCRAARMQVSIANQLSLKPTVRKVRH
jgi:hypothetical protein